MKYIIFICVIIFLLLNILKYKCKANQLFKESMNFKKNFNLLNQWMFFEIAKKPIADVLKERGYKRVAIYGVGEISKRLIEELQLSGKVEVNYCIHINKDNLSSIIPIIEPYEINLQSSVDVIIVGELFEKENLIKLLKENCNFDILFLEDIVYED